MLQWGNVHMAKDFSGHHSLSCDLEAGSAVSSTKDTHTPPAPLPQPLPLPPPNS